MGAVLGYVFLFFYGLERRLLVDDPSPSERDALIVELHRLQGLYGASSSFRGYSAGLLREIRLRETLSQPGWEASLCPDPLTTSRDTAALLQIVIGRAVAAGQPIGFDLALATLLSMPPHLSGISNKQSPRRARAAFVALLRPRFAEKFPQGLTLRDKQGSTLALTYRAASQSLNVPPINLGRRLPDAHDLTWTKLIDLCVQAADDLILYSRALKADGSGERTPEALVALPVALKAARFGPLGDLGTALDGLPDVSVVALDDLWQTCLGARPPTIKDVSLIGALLAGLGYGIEPDPVTGKGALPSVLGVVRAPGGTADIRGTSPQLSMGRFAASFVMALGHLEDAAAMEAAFGLIDSTLTPFESLRLAAHLQCLAEGPLPVASVLRKSAQGLDPQCRAAAATLLLDVAVAAGAQTAPQVALLESLFDRLGQDRSAIYPALHRGASVSPVMRAPHRAAAASPVRQGGDAASNGTTLDMDAISRIRAETDRVSAILSSVYVDDPGPPRVQPVLPAAEVSPTFEGLEAAHIRFATVLLTRAAWSRADYETEGRRHGLLPDAAAETLNDWAYARFDDALLEDDGDMILVNPIPAKAFGDAA